MAISLHTAVVGTYTQFLPQVSRLIDKAEAHCETTGTTPDALAQSCLAPDMWPFGKQVQQVAHHSQRAIEAVRAGEFSPQPGDYPKTFAAMREEIAGALAMIEAIDPAELDSIADRDMLFRIGEMEMPFTIGNFLLSFSVPNFFFHVTTAYNILRMSGLEIGKPDYLGRLRRKR